MAWCSVAAWRWGKRGAKWTLNRTAAMNTLILTVKKDWKRKAELKNELIIPNTPPGEQTALSKVNTEQLFYQFLYLVPASVPADTRHVVPNNPVMLSRGTLHWAGAGAAESKGRAAVPEAK